MLDANLIFDASLLFAMLIALLAGFLSFLSPCVLPVSVPYLAYMGGVSVTDMSEERAARRKTLLAAAFFVLGLSTVFLVLGAAASVFGRALLRQQDLLITISGLIIMLFGAHFIGVFRLSFMDREARVETGDRGGSAFGAYILGLAFAFGWTPCLGPILGAILGLAAVQADLLKGMVLLLTYALGLGIPFLLLAAFLPRLKGLMAWMKRHMERVERVSGLMLWTIGLMMLTGQFTQFSLWLLQAFPFLQALG